MKGEELYAWMALDSDCDGIITASRVHPEGIVHLPLVCENRKTADLMHPMAIAALESKPGVRAQLVHFKREAVVDELPPQKQRDFGWSVSGNKGKTDE